MGYKLEIWGKIYFCAESLLGNGFLSHPVGSVSMTENRSCNPELISGSFVFCHAELRILCTALMPDSENRNGGSEAKQVTGFRRNKTKTISEYSSDPETVLDYWRVATFVLRFCFSFEKQRSVRLLPRTAFATAQPCQNPQLRMTYAFFLRTIVLIFYVFEMI